MVFIMPILITPPTLWLQVLLSPISGILAMDKAAFNLIQHMYILVQDNTPLVYPYLYKIMQALLFAPTQRVTT